MKHIRAVAIFTFVFSIAAVSQAQTSDSSRSIYDDLIDATRFIQRYQETAAVSARVFGARAQGNDKEYAALMARAATADLTDFRVCISEAYAASPITKSDARELVHIFRSPIGIRLVDLSQQMAIADIERGYHKPIDPSLLSYAERLEIADVYQRPAYIRYSTFMAGQANAAAVRSCIATSNFGKESGVKF